MKQYLIILLTLAFSFVSSSAKAESLSSPAQMFKSCAKCHGKDGLNPAFGTSEPIAGQPVEELIESINFFKESRFKGKGVILVMAKQVKNLTPEQITKLATYISKLKKGK